MLFSLFYTVLKVRSEATACFLGPHRTTIPSHWMGRLLTFSDNHAFIMTTSVK